MYLIIKNEHRTRIEYFKRKGIRFWLCYWKYKLKGNEVDIVDV